MYARVTFAARCAYVLTGNDVMHLRWLLHAKAAEVVRFRSYFSLSTMTLSSYGVNPGSLLISLCSPAGNDTAIDWRRYRPPCAIHQHIAPRLDVQFPVPIVAAKLLRRRFIRSDLVASLDQDQANSQTRLLQPHNGDVVAPLGSDQGLGCSTGAFARCISGRRRCWNSAQLRLAAVAAATLAAWALGWCSGRRCVGGTSAGGAGVASRCVSRGRFRHRFVSDRVALDF